MGYREGKKSRRPVSVKLLSLYNLSLMCLKSKLQHFACGDHGVRKYRNGGSNEWNKTIIL